MQLILRIAVLVSAAWLVQGHAAVIGGPIDRNGHTYYLLDNKPWLDQQAEAIALGGHLVTINDADENKWVWDTFGTPNTGLFFGFNDLANAGTFVWASGEAVTFTNWRAGEPNNVDSIISPGGEFFGELASDYQWNDVGTRHTWRAVAEVAPSSVPEPGSVALLALALAGLGVGRRQRR